MKNKEIRNRIRNRRDNAAETRGNIRNKRARTMVMTLCAALALGQAGIGISARAADSRRGYIRGNEETLFRPGGADESAVGGEDRHAGREGRHRQ